VKQSRGEAELLAERRATSGFHFLDSVTGPIEHPALSATPFQPQVPERSHEPWRT